MCHPAGPPMPPSHPGGPPPGAPAVCVRHPDRATGLTCTRCGRPACPECLREASVGYQCVDCVREGSRTVRRGATVAGAEPGGRPVVVPTLIALNVAVFVWTVVQARSIGSNADSPLFDAWALVPGAVRGRRVVAGGHVRLPAHRPDPPAVQHDGAVGARPGPGVGAGPRPFPGAVPDLAARRRGRGDLFYGPNQAVAGASGAVFGLMGGLAVVLKRLRVPAGQVIGLIAVNVVISVVIPGISLIGHLGGLVVGAAATARWSTRPPRNQRRRAGRRARRAHLLVLVVMAVTGADDDLPRPYTTSLQVTCPQGLSTLGTTYIEVIQQLRGGSAVGRR